MRRIQKGPVRGISFKLQEEERERKDSYVPEVSALNLDKIEIDEDTKAMVDSLGFSGMEGLAEIELPPAMEERRPRRPQRF
jgi:small subunit ribosomal protein S17e